MEILLIIGFIAAVVLPLHLLNRRDAEERMLAAALRRDPRLAKELMCARDRQEAHVAADAAAAPAVQAFEDERQAA